MAEKPIKTPLPADLPEDWNAGQIIAPTGEEVDLSHQHGYNYLMEMVNRTQRDVNQINNAFESISIGAARRVVGTSKNGWTKADCDFLCDGTDDQDEINMALNSLSYGRLGEVILLPGQYYLSSPVTIGETRWLHGMSPNTVKLIRNTADGYGEKKSIIHIRRGKLSDVTFTPFDGVSDDTFDISVALWCDISNVYFESFNKNSIYISGNLDGDIRVCDCKWLLSVDTAIYAVCNGGLLTICNNICSSDTFIHLEPEKIPGAGTEVRIEGNGTDGGIPGSYYLDISADTCGNIIRGNLISEITIVNSEKNGFPGSQGNLISGNIFWPRKSEVAITLGENTRRWFVVGNNLLSTTSGVSYNFSIEDLGDGNVVRFNSNDTGTGGGGSGATVHGLPAGGKTGQILGKKSDTSYDAGWVDAPTSPTQPSTPIEDVTKDMVKSQTVRNIVTLTETEYTALTSKAADTLYLIKE